MYYETLKKQEQFQEKENSNNNSEANSISQTSEEYIQITRNNESNSKSKIPSNNYLISDEEIYKIQKNKKEYSKPYYISKYNIEKDNKDNNYYNSETNLENYKQRIFDYNSNDIRKTETEINNNKNDKYSQNSSYKKYEIKDKKISKNAKPLSLDKEKNKNKLNFSYDENENENNFDTYINKIKNVINKEENIKKDNTNITFNKRLDTENSTNTKNLKYNFIMNNIKINNNPSEKKINYEKDENSNIDKISKKSIPTNNNYEYIIKNEKENKTIKKQTQILDDEYKKDINHEIKYDTKGNKENEKEINIKPENYFFSYDHSTKIKNYDNKTPTIAEYSTEIDTNKYKKYPEYKNIDVSEFKVNNNDNDNDYKNKKEYKEYKNQSLKTSMVNYSLNNKEKNYINNLKTLNDEINKEKPKINSYINENNKINIDNNQKLIYENIPKYSNSVTNLINNKNNSNNLSSLLKKEYTFAPKIINASQENLLSKNNFNFNKENRLSDYMNTNQEEEIDQKRMIETSALKRDLEPNVINENREPMIYLSNNLNTLESTMIKRMDEEEEIRTLELEKERQKLNELEKEKQKLLLEEKERRERIIKEIERQEKQEIERKKMMRKKYDEKLRKRKEDEEKLLKIKEEQRKQIEEINELKNNKKYDEQKLLLLTEGKLNKKERMDYMYGITNHNMNMNINNLPYDINNLKEDNNDKENNNLIINKMKSNIIEKNTNNWNYKNNFIYNSDFNNSIESADNYNKDNFEEIENNSENEELDEFKYKSIDDIDGYSEIKEPILSREEQNIENININTPNFNNKNSKTINKAKNQRINNDGINEYKTFSPKISYKNNIYSLSSASDLNNSTNHKISAKLSELDDDKNKSFEDNKNIKELKENFENKKNEEENLNTNESINKDYYEKKGNNLIKNHIFKSKSFKKNIGEEKKCSFAKLKELREITSKLASEVEKKIESINKNKLFSKTKSSDKITSYSKFDYKMYNSEANKKNDDEVNIDKEEDKNEKDNILNKKSFKYNQLIKDIKIETSNSININQNKFSKKKLSNEEHLLPENIKKECISELKKIENITKKRGKENMQINTIKVNKILDNINKNKKEGISYKLSNQKYFYKEYLYGNKKKIKGKEIDQKFLPYYKEIYGETTPAKDS